jgi:hypothetical protein
VEILEPVRDYFVKNKEAAESKAVVEAATITR